MLPEAYLDAPARWIIVHLFHSPRRVARAAAPFSTARTRLLRSPTAGASDTWLRVFRFRMQTSNQNRKQHRILTCVYLHVPMYVCMHVCMHACMYVLVCLYVCTYVFAMSGIRMHGYKHVCRRCYLPSCTCVSVCVYVLKPCLKAHVYTSLCIQEYICLHVYMQSIYEYVYLLEDLLHLCRYGATCMSLSAHVLA